MGTVTYLGSSSTSRPTVIFAGQTFQLNSAVPCEIDDVLLKCWQNQFFWVEGWSPESADGDQPRRDDASIAPAEGRIDRKKRLEAEAAAEPSKPARPETPPPLPPEEESFPEDEPQTVTIDDSGRVVDNDDDLPAIISGAQKLDIDGDGEPDVAIVPVHVEEPEPAAEPAQPRRRRRRRNAN